jgi:hypothetical protein
MKGINENSLSIIGDATDKINFFYQRYSIIQQVERKLGYSNICILIIILENNSS